MVATGYTGGDPNKLDIAGYDLGDVIAADVTGVLQPVAIGTTGEVLTVVPAEPTDVGWEPGGGGPGAGVSSFNGRTGAVVPVAGDYTAAQVTNAVAGPATATANAIARYDATTGKLIKDSGVTLSDGDVIAGANGITLDGVASPAYVAGQLVYDTGNESLTFFNSESEVGMQVGQEVWLRVRNVTGSTIANGVPVYISGSNSGLPTIALAANGAPATIICAGLTTHAIENNTNGYVTVIGIVRDINTAAFAAGATVYVGATAGTLTATAPASPAYRYRVGIVAVSSATVGSISVTPSTAALGNGTANQFNAINNAGTAQEYKSLTVGTGLALSFATPNVAALTLAANLVTLSGLTPTTGNMILAVAGAWASQTPTQVKAALAIAQSDVSGLTAALALLAPLASPALTGTATAVNLTLSGRYVAGIDTLTSGTTVASDWSLGNQFRLSLAHNATLSNPTNPADGQMVIYEIIQTAGANTLALGAKFNDPNVYYTGLSAAAGTRSILGVRYNLADDQFDVMAFAAGY